MSYKLPVLLLMSIPYVVYFNPVACFYPVLYVSFISIKLKEKKLMKQGRKEWKGEEGKEDGRMEGRKWVLYERQKGIGRLKISFNLSLQLNCNPPFFN